MYQYRPAGVQTMCTLLDADGSATDQRFVTGDCRPWRLWVCSVTYPCATWAHVSADEQESGNQLADLRQWTARRSLDVAAQYVLDGASAWKGEHIQQLAEAHRARLCRCDMPLCSALDRLSREGVEATLRLLRRFHESGAPVWSPREPWIETADVHTAELLGAIYAWRPAPSPRVAGSATRPGSPGAKAEGMPSAAAPSRRTASPRWPSGHYALQGGKEPDAHEWR